MIVHYSTRNFVRRSFVITGRPSAEIELNNNNPGVRSKTKRN